MQVTHLTDVCVVRGQLRNQAVQLAANEDLKEAVQSYCLASSVCGLVQICDLHMQKS